MIRVIILGLLLVGVSAGAKAWLAQAPTTTPPPPVTTPADLELTVMNNVLTILN